MPICKNDSRVLSINELKYLKVLSTIKLISNHPNDCRRGIKCLPT